MSSDVKLPFYNPLDMKNSDVTVFLAPRGSGKSTMIEHLLYERRFLVVQLIIISPSEPVNRYFERFVPKAFIFDELDPDKIIPAIKYRQELLSHNFPPGVTDPNLIVILDDCIYDAAAFKNKLMKWLLLNGRQYHIGLWVVSQYTMLLPTWLRTNTDNVFLFREKNLGNLKKAYDIFFSATGLTFEELQDLNRDFTRDYNVLVYNNNPKGKTISDAIKRYKAKLHPTPWTFGPQAANMMNFSKLYLRKQVHHKVDWSKFEITKPGTTSTKKQKRRFVTKENENRQNST